MRVTDVTSVGSTLRAERDELLARHQQAQSRPATVPSRPAQKKQNPEDGGAADPTPAPRKKWTTKLVHPAYQIVGDECPNCDFPEAEGGYCPECGWSLPHPLASRR